MSDEDRFSQPEDASRIMSISCPKCNKHWEGPKRIVKGDRWLHYAEEHEPSKSSAQKLKALQEHDEREQGDDS